MERKCGSTALVAVLVSTALTLASVSCKSPLADDPEPPKLAALAVVGHALTPSFAPDVMTYAASVPWGVASAEVIATAEGSGATVTGMGTISLATGANPVVVRVAREGLETAYSITITRDALSDAEAVALDAAALSLAFQDGDTEGSVTGHLGLPTAGSNGSAISWSSDAEAVIGTTGLVARPDGADAVVTLGAALAKGAETATRDFIVTVKARSADPATRVTDDLAAIRIGYAPGESETDVRSDLALPSVGPSGSSYSWTSSAVSVVTDTGHVFRPPHSGTDASVILTARADNGGSSGTRDFALTILKQPSAPALTVVGLVSFAAPARSATWTWSAAGATEFRYSVTQLAEISPEDASWSAWGSATSANQASGEGTFYCRVQARDGMGGLSDIATATALLDNTAPAAPSPSVVSGNGSARPSWAWPEVDGAFAYRLGFKEGSWFRETATAAYDPSIDLGYGTTTLYVQARDAAGNWSSSGNAASLRASPTAPSLAVRWQAEHPLGTYDADSCVAAVPGRLYSSGLWSLKFFDMAAAGPTLRKELKIGTGLDTLHGIAAEGARVAVIGSGAVRFRLYDATDMANPVLKGTANLPAIPGFISDARVVMTATRAVVLLTDSAGFYLGVYDFSGAGGAPVLKGSLTVASSSPSLDGFAADDSTAVFTDDGTFRVVDLTNPAALSVAGTCYLSSSFGTWPRLAMTGTRVAVESGLDGLWVISIADKASPVKAYSFKPSGSSPDVTSVGGELVVYSASYSGDFVEYFALGATSATLLGKTAVAVPDGARDIVADPSRVYLKASVGTGPGDAIASYSVSSRSLTAEAWADLGPMAHGFAAAGTHAYASEGANGVGIFDVAATTGVAARVGAIKRAGVVLAVAVDGDRLHTLWKTDGKVAYVSYDISSRATPVELATLQMPSASADRLVARGGLVAAVAYDKLYVIRNAAGASPIFASASGYAPGGTVGAIGFFRDGMLACTLSASTAPAAGFLALDLTDPAAPLVFGTAPAPAYANGLAVMDSRIYVRGLGTLAAYELAEPSIPLQLETKSSTYTDFLEASNGWLFTGYYSSTAGTSSIRACKASAGLATGFTGAPTATLAGEIQALGAGAGRLFASQSVSGFGLVAYTLW